ncbi:hypothetical protein GIB67_017470 [Kingdonia uniflora]|uniref:Uncharacterized protein n=1 Tax=Kingdonia uniflora TaxID=39325 RepID=A0A7J7M4D5_9MAGN|nr:hypothetical protein GIB67_017470 [Kingdonia uniflora]
MRSKNPKPSSKFVVSTRSEESSLSDRTMDDSVVIGIVTADNPSVSSGRDAGLHAGDKTGQFFKYPENVDVAKKFLQYEKSLDREWGNYVMIVGLWFRTLVRPSGNVEHYQVPFLDRWKKSMDIGNDINIVYYNGTGSEVVEEGFLCYFNQVACRLSIPLTFFPKGKWRDGGIARQFAADDVLKYYKFKYVKDRKIRYLFSDSGRPKFFDFESFGRPWCDHLVTVRGNCMQVPGEPVLELIFKNFNEKPNPKVVADTLSLFNVVSREGSDLNKVLRELGIRRGKRLNSVVEKVQRAHQKQTMAASGSAYANVMGVNLKTVEQEALNLATRDPICLDTQIRSSISQLSVAWKSAAEVLKLAAANRGELVRQHDAEKAALQEQFEQEKVMQRENVDLSLAGKYDEILFPGDDVFLVAEQTSAPPVADDPTKEEVVHLRGKVIEMEKALSRARDSINRTRQGQRAMRILFFSIKREDIMIHTQLEIYLRHAYDELKRYKGHNVCLEREKVECARLLQNFEKRVTLLEVHLLDMQQRLQVSQSCLKKKITLKRGKCAIDTEHERQMADVITFYGGELERVENEFRRYISSCGKDVEVENDKVENMWLAKGNEGGEASISK